MPISMYEASVPVLKQFLGSLSGILSKAEQHAAERKLDPDALLQARLFPDMFALTRQVQIAADFAKGIAARLAGVEVPSFEDNEATFAELRARIDKTLAFIDGIRPEQMEGSETRQITLNPGTPRERSFNGQVYLTQFGLPQFFFHVTTAYALLRHNGLPIGKKDYIGNV
ncbi:DUF1993 domain-containing protein [Noviherbaspirillum galbum]|uniref:DUF1993 domain-containing protein n=1 Tax=Noviherbaspirillum galbum TaxID=2709383 RepID=A0A6B3SQ45_9BURK|nr:DUF1993 domain-containing protein [Noviherbaspirillum galbum]NEX60532.1 DUF1993 domain-containing protein [Noviherbaspirillum galbum]